MGIPIIVDGSERLQRTGTSFRATCPTCREPAKMHEGAIHTNVSLFFAISLWDSDRAVVQCGECMTIFDEETARQLRAAPEPVPTSFIERLLSPAPARPASTRPASTPPAAARPVSRRPPIDESAIDAELEAMKKRLGRS